MSTNPHHFYFVPLTPKLTRYLQDDLIFLDRQTSVLRTGRVAAQPLPQVRGRRLLGGVRAEHGRGQVADDRPDRAGGLVPADFVPGNQPGPQVAAHSCPHHATQLRNVSYNLQLIFQNLTQHNCSCLWHKIDTQKIDAFSKN
jgi:hypothetical protein